MGESNKFPNIGKMGFGFNPMDLSGMQTINLKSGTNMKNMKPVNKKIDYFTRYSSSFVDDNDFNTKRLQRYSGKVKAFIFEQLTTFYPSITKEYPNITDLNSFCVSFLQSQYMQKNGEQINQCMSSFLHKGIVPMNICNSDVLEKLFLSPSEKYDVIDLSLYDIIDNEMCYVVKEYLRMKSASDSEITKSNYSSYVPEEISEALLLFKELIILVCNDIDRICYSNVSQSVLDVLQSDLVKKLNDEYEDMDAKFKQTSSELKDANATIKRLQEQLESIDSKFQQQFESMCDSIDELERKNQKADKKYENLLEKYNRLKNKKNDSSKDEEEEGEEKEEKEYIDVDMNGRYLFIIGNGATFKGIIKESFPNAEFMNDNTPINKDTYDMVIIITSHIDHSTYFIVRDQCKNKNIPYIHCKFSNVDRIKQSMFDFLNKTRFQ